MCYYCMLMYGVADNSAAVLCNWTSSLIQFFISLSGNKSSVDVHLAFLLYFAWENQRVQQFYKLPYCVKLVVIELWLGRLVIKW